MASLVNKNIQFLDKYLGVAITTKYKYNLFNKPILHGKNIIFYKDNTKYKTIWNSGDLHLDYMEISTIINNKPYYFCGAVQQYDGKIRPYHLYNSCGILKTPEYDYVGSGISEWRLLPFANGTKRFSDGLEVNGSWNYSCKFSYINYPNGGTLECKNKEGSIYQYTDLEGNMLESDKPTKIVNEAKVTLANGKTYIVKVNWLFKDSIPIKGYIVKGEQLIEFTDKSSIEKI